MKSDLVRAALLAGVMVAAAGLALWLTPSRFLADQVARERLASIVPASFGDWQIDRSIIPVPPSPDVQRIIDATYDETLALTYRNGAGQRIMLSLAYGRNQHKGMNTHRPEVCYPAQGFKIVAPSQTTSVSLGQREIAATRLVAAMGTRIEPITYWLLVGEHITPFGYPQRWVAIRYGLTGLIPDGVLVRVSSIDAEPARAYALHQSFIHELLATLPPQRLARLVGSPASAH